MATIKATITRSETKTTLLLPVGGKSLELVLTEDKPNEVKNVFNQLLVELKKGEFNFELEDSNDDLYYHISHEYLSQLNTELSSIYKELSDYDLLDKGK